MSSRSRFATRPPSSYSAAILSSPPEMAAASSADTIPCFASIATCAFDPAMSCRHNRLSNGMEAFISRMIEAGPSAKRPTHKLLEPAAVRYVIAILLLCCMPFLLCACERHNRHKEQEESEA